MCCGRSFDSKRPGRAGGEALRSPRPKTPPPGPATPPHLHVGHEALLDSPAVFIDLFQELQLIVVVATHGGGGGGTDRNSPLRFQEQKLPRCPEARGATFRHSTRRRSRPRGRTGDGKRRGSKLAAPTAFLSVPLGCPLVLTIFLDSY